jgi:hypothetical protein
MNSKDILSARDFRWKQLMDVFPHAESQIRPQLMAEAPVIRQQELTDAIETFPHGLLAIVRIRSECSEPHQR